MRYVSIFSGVEAATLAWEPLGWEPLAFAEVDRFPSAVLAERWPDVPNLGDVTEVKWNERFERGSVGLVVGGSPCQSFSVAGRRDGLDGASGLMWEWVRCVRELMPRWVVWENVPGALSSGHGVDFGCLLRSVDDIGYGVVWRVLDAQFFGVAQRRRRVFLVGRLGAEPPIEVLFEPDGLRRDHPTSREKREALAARAGRGAAVAGFKYSAGAGAGSIGYSPELSPTATATCPAPATVSFAQNSRDEVRVQGDGQISGALAARPGAKQQTYVAQTWCLADDNAKAALDLDMCGTLKVCGSAPQVVRHMQVRRLTPLECERLQGFPDNHTRISWRGKPEAECPDGPRYKAIGNSMAVPVMRWIGERIQICEKEEDNG